MILDFDATKTTAGLTFDLRKAIWPAMVGFLQKCRHLCLSLQRCVFAACCSISVLSLFAEPANGATVAVFPANRDANSFSDALTASLSQITNVVTLERAQIERVLREQELSLTQPQSIIRAGRLLNAEGFVLLEQRISQATNVLAVRMVATAPGVVVAEQEFPLPLRDLSDWSTNLSVRLGRMIGKLTVTSNDAVAVSITGLRSAVSTSSGVALERDLTAMLRLRLSQHPSVFVLERRSMDALERERQISPSETSFWNGAIIIEGVINREIVSADRITINARLLSPKRTPVELMVTGSQKSLVPVIDDLVGRILGAIGKPSSNQPWNATAEAEQFLAEAQWAANWGLWSEVAYNADAAWALGKQTPLAGAFRVTSRAWVCLGMRGPASYEYVGPYGFNPPPQPEILPTLARAIEIYREPFPRFAAATNATRTGWASLGLDLLLVGARVLDRFSAKPEYCEGRETELRDVRALCRELNSLLLTNSGLGMTGLTRNLQGLPTVYWHTKNGPVSKLPDAWLDAGGVWFETPEDALVLYRKLIALPNYRQTRAALFNLPLVGWSPRDRIRLRSVWVNFGKEMTLSSNVQVRLDGWRNVLTHAVEPKALEEAAEQMLEEAVRSRVTIYSDLLEAPVASVLTNTLRRIGTWGIFDTERRIDEVRKAALTRLNENDPELSYAIWKNLLTDLTIPTNRSPAFRRPEKPPSPTHVSELIVELEKLELEKRTRWPVRAYIESLRGYAPAVDLAPQAAKTFTDKNERRRGVLNFSRVWHIEEAQWPSDQGPHTELSGQRIMKGSSQGGYLSLEVQTYGNAYQGASPKLAFIHLTPGTMHSEVSLAPFQSVNSPHDYQRQFLMITNDLLVANGGELWRRSARGGWAKSPLPTATGGVLYQWGNHVVLSTGDAILEFAPETGDVRILASTRRNPPVSLLDRRSLNRVPLAVWPNNILCAAVEGQVWQYDRSRNDWRVFASATNCSSQSIELLSDGVFFREGVNWMLQRRQASFLSKNLCGALLFGGWRPDRSRLDYYTWAPSRDLVNALEPFTPPRWQHPAGAFPHECQAQFEAGNVWVFPVPFADAPFASDAGAVGRFNQQIRGQTNYIPTTILFLDASKNETLELEIGFSGPAHGFMEAYEREHALGRSHCEFVVTDQGLAIIVLTEGIVLWVTREELNSALTAARDQALPGYALGDNSTARFDKTGKGWLDDAEDRAMRRDSVWGKKQAELREVAIKREIRSHSAEWDKIFAESDENHDGKLSLSELDSAAKMRPAMFAHRVAGLNGTLWMAVRPFNLDNDLGLNREEFRLFMAEPRLPAEVIQSTDWVTRFGLKPEECDENHDGVLDAKERAKIVVHLRRRSATP